MDYELQGRVALVTGGGSGIGAATSHVLAMSGAVVAVADKSLDAARATVESLRSLGFDAYAVHVDVTDEQSVDEMVTTVLDGSGRLDIAVNSAGIGAEWNGIGDTPTETWHQVMAVNLDGVFFSMRAEIRAMRHGSGGSIVNVASCLSQAARAGSGPYASSKHAVLGLTRTAALDHAAEGIRVNAVAPGFIDTPLLRGRHDAQSVARLESQHPLGRLGTAEEIGEAIGWLASPAAGFVTGAMFAIDGGYLVP